MDDYVFSVIFSKVDEYSDFRNLSLVSKKLFKVSKIIRKKWKLNYLKKFPMLCSFVKEEDLMMFFNILWKMYHGKLKEECSILYIKGPYCSGKSTLADILIKICGERRYITKTNFLSSSFDSEYILMTENSAYNLEIFSKKINEGFYVRKLHGKEFFIENPAMAIIKEDDSIKENVGNRGKRKIIHLNLKGSIKPCSDRHEVVKKSSQEYKEFLNGL